MPFSKSSGPCAWLLSKSQGLLQYKASCIQLTGDLRDQRRKAEARTRPCARLIFSPRFETLQGSLWRPIYAVVCNIFHKQHEWAKTSAGLNDLSFKEAR